MAVITDSLRVLPLLLAATLSIFTGCGGEKQIDTYAVTGQIVYPDGTPVTRGLVQFQAANSSVPVLVGIEYGDDGKFELSAAKPNYKEKEGLPAGDYEVIVMPEVPDDRGTLSQKEFLRALHPIDTRYRSFNSSGLKFTVSTDAGQNDYKIEVRRPRK